MHPVAANAVPNLPASHGMHCGLPGPLLYVPGPQSRQPCSPELEASENEPPGQGLHTVPPSLVPPTCISPVWLVTYRPAAHTSHAADPFSALKVPAGQSAHEPCAGLNAPALHTHCAILELALSECEWDGQRSHFDVPLTALNVPGKHARQWPEKLVGAGAQDSAYVPLNLGGPRVPFDVALSCRNTEGSRAARRRISEMMVPV